MLLGRLLLERYVLQQKADALALLGAYHLEQNGLPFNPPAVASMETHPFPDEVAAHFRIEHQLLPHRALVHVVLHAGWPLLSEDFSSDGFLRLRGYRAHSSAQINEMTFNELWPAVLLLVDASNSMDLPLEGSYGRSAFEVLRQVMGVYGAHTLPARTGLILFNDRVVREVLPPSGPLNNEVAIDQAMAGIKPGGLTNVKEALARARLILENLPGGHNLILISDGEPTAGGACGRNPCHFAAAQLAAAQLRVEARTAIFTVEIRRKYYTKATSQFLQSIAGGPLSAGRDATMHYRVEGQDGINHFIRGLTRGVCAFGPLSPASGAPAQAGRSRSTRDDLQGPPRRVFAFIREADGQERALPFVDNHPLEKAGPGFEYSKSPSGDYLILTLRSCNDLGADPRRRLLVRWDDAQLVLR
jgi:hypothetical protein